MELMEIVTCSVEIFSFVSFIIVVFSWLLFKLKRKEVKPQIDPIMIIYCIETWNPEYIMRKRLSERFVLINKNYGEY
jgi:hypothetical protein